MGIENLAASVMFAARLSLSLMVMVFVTSGSARKYYKNKEVFPFDEADTNNDGHLTKKDFKKRYCDDDSSCKQTEFCHQLTVRGVCAPKGLECQEDKDCPNIGNKFVGSVTGMCGSSGGCEWASAEIIM